MTYTKRHHNYSARRIRRYSYPNAAEPSYFAGKLLDGITILVTSMGSVTLILYFLTF